MFPREGRLMRNVLKIILKLFALFTSRRTLPSRNTLNIEAWLPPSIILKYSRIYVDNDKQIIAKSNRL
jgi:hypothetical protein